MLRRVVVLVEEDADLVVVVEVLGLAQQLDELLHILHRLLVRLPADFLQVQSDELRPTRFDVRQKFRDPVRKQTRRLWE